MPVITRPSLSVTTTSDRHDLRVVSEKPARTPGPRDGHHDFRPDIEGLRALAVVAVLGFHAFVPHLAGGFIGVDLFFVISGFLITGLLLDEHRRTGRISFAAFYARRARRILPAAAVVLLAVSAASYLLLSPLRRVDVMRDVLASTGYAVNWRFIQLQTDYLAANRDPSPLLHFWSLAVEEQFYIVWPLLIVALVVAARWLRIRTTAIVLLGALGVVAGSFLLSRGWTSTSAPLAYLSSPSRAWQFAGGGAVAALLRLRTSPRTDGPSGPRRLRYAAGLIAALLGWAGVGLIMWSILTFNTSTVYPGTAALLPTGGGLLLVLTGSATGPSSVFGPTRVLSLPSVRWIGRLSYSWYLWHWPVLVFAQARYPQLRWPALVALVVASAVPAWLTMRLVEDPVRRSRAVASRPFRGMSVGVTALVLPLAVALVVGSGALVSMNREAAAATAARAHKLANLAATGDPFGGAETGGAVIPATSVARKDTPHYPADCIVGAAITTSPPCVIDPSNGEKVPLTPRRVVLIGDSHAGQWFPVAAAIARKRHWDVEVLTKSGCPLADLRIVNPELHRVFTECAEWREATLQRLANEPRPALVLMSTLNRYVTDDTYLLNGWRRTLARLATLDAPLVYLADTPYPQKDVPACVSGALAHWSRCAMPRAEAVRQDAFAAAAQRGSMGPVTGVSMNRWLCPAGATCPAVRGGVLLYRDESHVTDTAMTLLGPAVDRLLTAQRTIPNPASAS